MNKNQKLATFAALGLLLITIIFAPWQKVERASGHIMGTKTIYGFIMAPPDTEFDSGQETRLALSVLLTTWSAIGIIYGASMGMLRRDKPA